MGISATVAGVLAGWAVEKVDIESFAFGGWLSNIALLAASLAVRGAVTAGWIFQGGIVVFSGSLYALALTDVKILGAITPIGGIAFLAGWAYLAYGALRSV